MLLQIERASVKRAEGSKEEGRTVACTLYEARGESTRAVSADDLLTVRAESAEATSTCPLLTVLSKDPKVELVESAFGEVPFGGTLAYHLRQDDKVPFASLSPSSILSHRPGQWVQLPQTKVQTHPTTHPRRPYSLTYLCQRRLLLMIMQHSLFFEQRLSPLNEGLSPKDPARSGMN